MNITTSDDINGRPKWATILSARLRDAENAATLSSFLDKINQHSDMSTRQLILSPQILDLKLDKVQVLSR